jgi:hypothetical protein
LSPNEISVACQRSKSPEFTEKGRISGKFSHDNGLHMTATDTSRRKGHAGMRGQVLKIFSRFCIAGKSDLGYNAQSG